MANLKLFDITDGKEVELVTVGSDPITVGREAGLGITLPSAAVSGEHAVFLQLGNHTFLKDLGSTNGSWVNGVKLNPNEQFLIRPGDGIQLADRAIKVKGDPIDPSTGRTAIVFLRGEYLDEFKIPKMGRGLVIGGSQANLKLEVDLKDLPALVIEGRGDSVVVFSVAKELPIVHDGEPITHTLVLHDRSDIKVERYRVIFNNPPQAAPVESVVAQEETAYRPRDEEFEPTAGKVKVSLPFGRDMPVGDIDTSDTDWHTPDVDASHGSEVHPAMRYSLEQNRRPNTNFENLEEKVIVIVGFLLLLGVLLLGIFWALS